MKVIAINGSPRADGNTRFALDTVGEVLRGEGVDFEVVHIGHMAIHGCTACGRCRESGVSKCVITSDCVNEVMGMMADADGIILGSPVYFSGIAGAMKCFLDRVFYAAGVERLFVDKFGASVVALRRAGGTTTFSALNYYLHIAQMRQVGSSYWNLIHGRVPGEASGDAEGVTTLLTLGRNFAQVINGR